MPDRSCLRLPARQRERSVPSSVLYSGLSAKFTFLAASVNDHISSVCKTHLCYRGGGFLGSFLVEELERRGCSGIIVPRRKDYDLTTVAGIERLFADARPQILFHLAARRRWNRS